MRVLVVVDMRFSKEIQGLRALAVLAVIFAHLEVSWLPGGFVGVDVFFVISGYLITGLLLREYQGTGEISLSNFYRRRIRRLFPAMLVTCMFALVGGFLLFSDERFELLLDSTLAALFSVSNFYFLSQVGYFDVESSIKPLLHTWSLGVEEQFYLVWPLLIMISLKYLSRSSFVVVLIVLSAASFGLNWAFISYDLGSVLGAAAGWRAIFLDGGSTAFYLMPFRIFEFGIGALLVLLRVDRLKIYGVVADILLLTALSGLLVLMMSLTGRSVFPYYNALWVALLAAALIVIAPRSRLGRLVLANPLAVFVGGISYSLYLVHWPLIVYYRTVFGALGVFDMLVLLSVIFGVGYALYVCVECRFRYAENKFPLGIYGFFSRSALAILLVMSVGAVFWLKAFEGRVPVHRVALSNSEWRIIERRQYCSGNMDGFPKALFTCQNDRGSNHTVVLWGDSHAMHLVAGISELFKDANIVVAYVSACISQSGFDGVLRKYPSRLLTEQCVERNRSFLSWAEGYKGDLTIFISNVKRNRPEAISKINNQHVRMLEGYGHPAYVIGDFIRPGVQLAQCYAVPDFIFSDERLKQICKADAKAAARELAYSYKLGDLSINYIPVHEAQCPKGQCRFFDDEGRVTFRDEHHLSPIGSIYEVSQVSPLLKKIRVKSTPYLPIGRAQGY